VAACDLLIEFTTGKTFTVFDLVVDVLQFVVMGLRSTRVSPLRTSSSASNWRYTANVRQNRGAPPTRLV
jgi:hypothetical protein